LVIFGALVGLASWAQLGVFRDLDPRVLQAIGVLALFGAALVIVGVLRRIVMAQTEDD
jgi:hypothetical protein